MTTNPILNEKDPFIDAGINNIQKKLELEELEEELESAEYEKEYPELDNIYDETPDTLEESEILKQKELGERLKERKHKKNIESTEQEEIYKSTQPDVPIDTQSKIISFNELLDSYIDNKEILRSKIKIIQEKIKEAIEIRDILTPQISETNTPLEIIKFNSLIKKWVPNYKKYEEKIKEINKLFDFKDILDIIKGLYSELKTLLESPILESIKNLFIKVIYTSEELSNLLERLKNNNTIILEDYSDYNDYVMTKIKVFENNFENKYHKYQGTTLYSNIKKKILLIKGLEELKDELNQLKNEGGIISIQTDEKVNGFFKLVIESSDLYEKDGFKEGFEELLNYQPDKDFKFGYVFSQIEQGDYTYLDDFLKNKDIIPEKIYEDDLISQIKGSLAFKPVPQTR